MGRLDTQMRTAIGGEPQTRRPATYAGMPQLGCGMWGLKLLVLALCSWLSGVISYE